MITRAEARRRAQQGGQPAVVWGRREQDAAAGAAPNDAAIASSPPAPVVPVARPTVVTAAPGTPAAAAQPLTRRQARRLSQSGQNAPVPAVPQVTAPRAAAPQTALPQGSAFGLPPRTDSIPTLAAPASAAVARSASATGETIDAFAVAAELFSFTGRPAVGAMDEPETPPAAIDVVTGKHKERKPRRPRGRRMGLKRLAAASVSASAIVAVGLLTVSATLPAEAVGSSQTTFLGAAGTTQIPGDVAPDGSGSIQAYVAPADAAPASGDLNRSASYSTAALVEMAGSTGISNFSSGVFTNNPNCAVQWPFAVGVPISWGFGPRPGEFHEGVDFVPGNGAHVQAIADGVVRIATNNGGGYGVTVVIDHMIDGQHWASRYGHMQYGSLQVRAGEHVQVGQYIGRTGDTGFSFGAHTHVEILQNGVTPIDPLPWLRAHNQC